MGRVCAFAVKTRGIRVARSSLLVKSAEDVADNLEGRRTFLLIQHQNDVVDLSERKASYLT